MTPKERTDITRAAKQWILSEATDSARYDGLNQLISNQLRKNGATRIECFSAPRALLVGWLQESTTWDLVVFQQERPVLAVTYTSFMTSSDKGDIDRQTDRALGVARDTGLAQRHGLLPTGLRRAHVHVHELAAAPDEGIPEGTSDLNEAVTTSQRMRDSDLYDLVWVIGVTRDPLGFSEPAGALSWDRFAADLRPDID